MLWMDETGVFANPAEAGTLGEITLKDRTAICVPAVLYRTSNLLFDKLNEFLHARWENIVIVVAQSVGGDASLALLLSGEGVRGSQNENGFTLGKDFARVRATGTGTIIGKIIHRAMMPLYEPVFECGVVWGWFRSCHASQEESELG